MKIAYFYLLISAFLLSCTSQKKEVPLFENVPDCGIDFNNKVNNSIDFNIFNYRNFFNGGGVAIGDINNDGLADVFFTSNMGDNKLYLNKGGFKFEDISAKAVIANKDQWSTGVVMADINHDGWLDIFVCNAGYQNGKLPVCRLFINNHDLSFTESAKDYGLENYGGYTTQVAFFDYDLDGDLDCYILNNSFIPVNTLNYANKRNLRAENWPVADFLKGGGDKLLRNDNGKYTDVSESAHIYGSLIGFGLGVTIGDMNNDRLPDIYVSNDFFERDYLYSNQGDGTFKEVLETAMQHISHSSMGADLGDLNNDGFPEIFVTEMLPDNDSRLKTTTSFENIDIQKLKQHSGFYNQFMQNTLQVNNGNGSFSETAFYSGVAASDWSWGGLIFDADNDGLNDLYVCNGINQDVTNQDFIDFFANDIIQKMVLTGVKEEVDQIFKKMPSTPIPNKMYRNTGDLRFTDMAASWGMGAKSFSNGAAYGDLDNDGDLDLVVNNVNQQAFIYRNRSTEQNHNHYIGFRLKGTGNNPFAIGALVKLYQNGSVLSKELMPVRGFQSSVDYTLLFGLGKGEVDSATIIWPDRSITRLNKPTINRFHFLSQSAESPKWHPETGYEKMNTIVRFADSSSFEKHAENEFVDFYFERNIPEMLSREGPKAAVGDVNGDGLEDVFIGGAAGQGGQLYMQSAKGFVQAATKEQQLFETFEDVAVLLFDADKDGDKDLFIGSGGNEHGAGSRELQHRLYKNDGKGNFSITYNSFPGNDMNVSVAVPDDFDGDGDFDLFVGSRSVPFTYGNIPSSHLYRNDGTGKFTDLTHELFPQLEEAGMITGAVWANMQGDRKNELVIAGEWMAPRIFSFNGKKFIETATNISDKYGWWQSLAIADIDQDGMQDLILGNLGQNFYFSPEKDQQVKIWIADFDNNGSQEKILTRSVNGKDLPIFMKRELTDQIPSLKKQNLRHEQYANKTIQELFPADVLAKALVRNFNYASSCIAYNEGNGKFDIRVLPYQVNWSSVNAVCVKDMDHDGLKDLVVGGNIFALQPQFCRLDASYGEVLLNRGQRKFIRLSPQKSGINLTGVVRDINEITVKGEPGLLILRNNEKPVLYTMQPSTAKDK